MSLLFNYKVMCNSLWHYELQHSRLPYPSLSPGVCSNSCPLSQWCNLTISSSIVPFSSCPQSFPASRSFPMSWLFTSGGQNIVASASVPVLPMNTQNWFPLGLTGLLCLRSKGLSSVFSSTMVQKHPSLWSSSHIQSIRDYWKNHSFDYTDPCCQNDVSAF